MLRRLKRVINYECLCEKERERERERGGGGGVKIGSRAKTFPQLTPKKLWRLVDLIHCNVIVETQLNHIKVEHLCCMKLATGFLYKSYE